MLIGLTTSVWNQSDFLLIVSWRLKLIGLVSSDWKNVNNGLELECFFSVQLNFMYIYPCSFLMASMDNDYALEKFSDSANRPITRPLYLHTFKTYFHSGSKIADSRAQCTQRPLFRALMKNLQSLIFLMDVRVR